jgi:formylglycine-generating enzyme required for sulfatase activity
VSRIFISYRRDDTGGWTGRLYDRLSQHFGQDNVFMDVNTIDAGSDLIETIEQAVGSCDILVAVIGKQWLTITDTSGRRRLENPEDFVRLEIAAAIGRNIRVIPALVEGATMLSSSDLPDLLTRLARRHAMDISSTRFHYDVDQLIQVLDTVLGVGKPASSNVGNAGMAGKPQPAPEVPLTPPQQKEQSRAPRLPFEPEMILIPAGEFLMGSDLQKDEYAEKNERPQHTLYLPDYYLAKTPVTNAQYTAFVLATDHNVPIVWTDGPPPRGEENHPVVGVSWSDAKDYCDWLSEVTGRGYGLPSEAEWEKGARGTDGRIYPWGDQWDATRCSAERGDQVDATSVDAHPAGASPYGLLDMAGNVWEWTRSLEGQRRPTMAAAISGAAGAVGSAAGAVGSTAATVGVAAGAAVVAGVAVLPLALAVPVVWAFYTRKRPYGKYSYDPKDGRENLNASLEIGCVVRGGSTWDTYRTVRCTYRGTNFPQVACRAIGFRVVMHP